MSRLAFLDSYRAIAITAVAGFHFFARWCPPIADVDHYPYHARFAELAVFRFGSFGIDLFFLISGFVITVTLIRCDSLYEFAVKRVARLWPALLFCTALIYLIQLSPFDMPGTSPRPLDLVASLTTVEPKLLAMLGVRSDYVIGAVWTLFVELRFYALAGLGYFYLSRRHFVAGLLAFAIVAMAGALLRGSLEGSVGMVLTSLALVRSIGWFALGAYCFRLHGRSATAGEHALALVSWGLLVGLAWRLPPHLSPELLMPAVISALVTLLLPALFALSVAVPALRRPFERAWLVKLGVVSYSLYLIHETIGVALISRISPAVPIGGQLALVVAIYLFLILLAVLIFHAVENPGRDLVRRLMLREPGPTHEEQAMRA